MQRDISENRSEHLTHTPCHPPTLPLQVANLAEMLLIRGLAATIRHRSDEERASRYADLMAAEEQGKADKKGQWSGREPVTPRVNDISLPGSSTRCVG